jgi:membrane protease YdiL (CAAX protease family)
MLDVNQNNDKCHVTYNSKKGNNKILNLGNLKHIALFFIGFIGFQTLVSIAQFIILSFVSGDSFKDKLEIFNNDPFCLMMTLLMGYLATFLIMIIILLPNYKMIIEQFKSSRKYVEGLMMGIAIILFTVLYGALFNRFGNASNNQEAAEKLTVNYPFFSIFIIAIVGPIVEEITYRLGIFSFLSKVNRRTAYVVSAIIFGLIHFNFFSTDMLTEIINLPIYVGCGLLLNYTYEKYGLCASIVAHVFNNMLSTVSVILRYMN